MKKKQLKKQGETAKPVAPSTETSPAAIAPAISETVSESPGILKYGAHGEMEVWPHPEDLLHQAQQEPNYRDLADYSHVIRELRDKGFSFREISEWLKERGVTADHNAVYRIYTNSLTDREAMEEAQREEDENREEAYKQL